MYRWRGKSEAKRQLSPAVYRLILTPSATDAGLIFLEADMSVLSRLLPGRMIPFNVALGRACGGLAEAILVMQIAHWQDINADPSQDGFVHLSDEQLGDEILLTPKQLRRIRAKLSSRGIVEHRRRGVPARTWYRLNYDELERILLLPKGTTGIDEVSQQVMTKRHNLPYKEDLSLREEPPTPSDSYSPGFNAFWAAWPSHKRKANEEGAYAKWKSRQLEARAAEIIAAVEALKESDDWTKQNGQYIPGPVPWLNGRGYEVDLETLNAAGRLHNLPNGRRVTDRELHNVTHLG